MAFPLYEQRPYDLECRRYCTGRNIRQGPAGDFDYESLTMHDGSGYRIGAVCIPADHPWFEMHFSQIPTEIEGGLTFSMPGTRDDEWWIGFTCNRPGETWDPSLPRRHKHPVMGGIARSQLFVNECCYQLMDEARLANLSALNRARRQQPVLAQMRFVKPTDRTVKRKIRLPNKGE